MKLTPKRIIFIIVALVFISGVGLGLRNHYATRPESYVGLSLQDATTKAQKENRFYRIINLDEKDTKITADYRKNRLNLTIEKDKVISAEYY